MNPFEKAVGHEPGELDARTVVLLVAAAAAAIGKPFRVRRVRRLYRDPSLAWVVQGRVRVGTHGIRKK